jgi:hypothetical protein
MQGCMCPGSISEGLLDQSGGSVLDCLNQSMYRVVQREDCRGDMAVKAFVRSSTSCYLLMT